MGVLFLKRACFEDTAGIATQYASRGEEILRSELGQRGDRDAYPAAALTTHKLRYLLKWRPPNFNQAIEELYELARDANRRHPFNEPMEEAFKEVYRRYLLLAVREPETEQQ